MGVFAAIPKPNSEKTDAALVEMLKVAAGLDRPVAELGKALRENNSPDLLLPKFTPKRVFQGTTEPIIVIGASTGGPEALEVVLSQFPPDAPATVVVQHMPGAFTAQFAERLDRACSVRVFEAQRNSQLRRGEVVVAPGYAHLVLRRTGNQYFCQLMDGPEISRHRPSVDILMRSAAFAAGPNAVGAILTGMGADGAIGLAELRKAGAVTVAQDRKSCVVFGMPKEAIAAGGAKAVLPLNRIADFLMKEGKVRRYKLRAG